MSKTTGHDFIVTSRPADEHIRRYKPRKYVTYIDNPELKQRLAVESPNYFVSGSNAGVPAYGQNNVRFNIARNSGILKGEYLMFKANVSAVTSPNSPEWNDGYRARLLRNIRLRTSQVQHLENYPATLRFYAEFYDHEEKSNKLSETAIGLTQATRQTLASSAHTFHIPIVNPFRGYECLKTGLLPDDSNLYVEVDIETLDNLAVDSLGAAVSGTLQSLELVSIYSVMEDAIRYQIMQNRVSELFDMEVTTHEITNGSTSATISLNIHEPEFFMFYIAKDSDPFTPLPLTTYYLDLDGIKYPSEPIPKDTDKIIEREYFSHAISENIHTIRMGMQWWMDNIDDVFMMNASLNSSQVTYPKLKLTFPNPTAASHLYLMSWGRAIYEYKQGKSLVKRYKTF